MRKSELRGDILQRLRELIALSGRPRALNQKFQELHQLIIKRHYNAVDVSIDYHRNRIKMEILMDDKAYDPNTLNTGLTTLPANFYFNDIVEFLDSCLHEDQKSLAFYSGVLKSFSSHSNEMVLA